MVSGDRASPEIGIRLIESGDAQAIGWFCDADLAVFFSFENVRL